MSQNPTTTLADTQPWHTKRLTMRPWEPTDHAVTDAHDTESANYNPWGVPRPGHFHEWLDTMETQAARGSRISWAVVHGDNVVACVNIQGLNARHLGTTAFVGFWTRPQFRRQGYVAEVLTALITPTADSADQPEAGGGYDTLQRLGKKHLLARIHPENLASQSLVQRVGFRRIPAIGHCPADLLFGCDLQTQQPD